MRRLRGALAMCAAVALALVGQPAGGFTAEPATVTGVTTQTDGRELQIVIHATAPVRFEVQPVREGWIVVDILNARLGVPAGTIHGTEGVVERVRVGQFAPYVVRVVVECAEAVRSNVWAEPDARAVVVGIPGGAERPAAAAPPLRPAPRAATIVPGRSVGALHLGMSLRDVIAALGAAKKTVERPGLGTDYEWYAAPDGAGLGVRTAGGGVVRQIWVLNDPAYRTREGLHAGSTEEAVRAALGAPTWTVAIASQGNSTMLMYEQLGLWFSVRPSATDPGRNVVFRIDVMGPSSAGPPRNQ